MRSKSLPAALALVAMFGAGATSATWLWDPNLARLTPLDDAARAMSEAERQEVRTRPSRRSPKPVPDTVATSTPNWAASLRVLGLACTRPSSSAAGV